MGCGSSNAAGVVVNHTVPSSMLASTQSSRHLSTEILLEAERGELTDESSEGKEQKLEEADSIGKNDKTAEVSDGVESESEDDVQSTWLVDEMEGIMVTYVTYLSTDKKEYRPGERLFLRAVMLDANTQRPPLKAAEIQCLAASHPSVSIQQPSGLVVTWNVQLDDTDCYGAWGVQISIPEGAACGTYLAKAVYASLPELYCAPAERSFAVRMAQKQHTNLKLKFAKKKYIAGDKVHATLIIPPLDGESQRPVSVTANGTLEDKTMFTVQTTVTTGSHVPISFPLPSELPSSCDFSLVCHVSGDQLDASVIQPVPITQHVKLSAYPESGHLVVGLQCGLFFQAHTKNGEPIGVNVEVQELAGKSDWIESVCTAESIDDHGGYLLFCPKRNRLYRLVTIQSGHLSGVCNLPKPRARGVSLSAKKSVYEGGSPIWLRVGSSCRGSYSLRAFKLSSELFSVDLSFPPKESTFESRHSLDNCNKSENYNDVLVSLPSYVSGAIRVAVSNIKGMTVAKRIIFVKCTRRLSIVADAVWSSPPSTKKKDIEISIKTLEGKSQIPVSSHLGVTITREECFTEMNGLNLKLDNTSWFPEVNLSGLECLNLSDQMGENYIGQSLLFEFAALQQHQNCQGTEAEAVTTSNQSHQSFQLKTDSMAHKGQKSKLPRCLVQRLSSFQFLSGTTSQKQTSLNKMTKQLETSSTPRIWSAIEKMSCDQLTAAISATPVADLQSIRWQGETLVHGVARSHCTNKKKQAVRALLKFLLDEAGLDVDAQREGWSDGNTALHLACERGNHVIAAVLIDLGATHSLLNKWGMTPLSLAAGCGHTTIVQLLLDQEHRVKGNACDTANGVPVPISLCETGWSPLHYAAAGGHVDVIHAMKMYADVCGSELDFSIVTADELQLTPLHCSARYATVSDMATQVIEYLLRNGANDITDARGYSYKQLAYLKESEKFGRLSRYSPIQQVNEIKEYHVDVDVNYKGLSKTLPKVASTATVAAVVTSACQQFGISVPASTNMPFFFIDKYNQCLVDQTVLCAAAVTVVSSDDLCLCRLEGALQICLNMTFHEYLSQLVAVNSVEWEGPVLPDHGCIRLTSFLPGPGWSNDPKNLELCYTPAEYGLQEGNTVYFYSQLISEKKFPLRSTCLCDYGIQEQQVCKDNNSRSVEKCTVQLKLCPLSITGTISIVVMKDQPNREPPKTPENTAPAAESTQNQPKSTGKQQGKKAPPKEAPKKAPAKTGGKGRGPPGKLLKLNLSSFEPVKTVKEIILSQLGDHLQKEAGIEVDIQTQALTCDIYVGDIFQQDILPLYASSLFPLPTPAVVKVHPRIIPNYSNLTNLFDFWTTPTWIEMYPESRDSSPDVQTKEAVDECNTECAKQGESRDTGVLVSWNSEILSAVHNKTTEQPAAETLVVDTALGESEGNSVSAVHEIKVNGNTVETDLPTAGPGINPVNYSNGMMEETVKVATTTSTASATETESNTKAIQEFGMKGRNHVFESSVHQAESNKVMAEIQSTTECKNIIATVSQDNALPMKDPKTEESMTAEATATAKDGSLKLAEDDNKLENSKHPTEEETLEERKRLHFLAWYNRWKTGMLWWGIKTLCGHTSFLRWVKTDEATQMDRKQSLRNAEKEIICLGQDYCDSVDPIRVQEYSDDTFEKKEYEYGEDDSTHSSAAKEPVEIRVTSGVAERVPVEPVVKAALGALDWQAALGHKQGPAMCDGVIIQPCLVWGDRTSHVKGSIEPYSDTVYWAADVKTDNSGNIRLKVSVDPTVSSYKLKVDAFSLSGALGRVECRLAIQNPLRVDWIIPDCVCSGDIMFVPLTLSNCGLEVLDVELTCVIKGATFQISRLLLEGNEMVKEAGGVIGTVTVPCGGATYCMEIQVETLAPCAQAATISVTATAGQYTDTTDTTISVLSTDLWQQRFWAGWLEEGDIATFVFEIADSLNTVYEDTQLRVQGFDGIITLLSDTLDYLCSTPSMWLEQAASIAFIGTELLQHYSNTAEYSEIELSAYRVENAMKQLIKRRQLGGGFSRFLEAKTGACMEATSFALVMLSHVVRLRNADPCIVSRARDWLMEQLVVQRRRKRLLSEEKPERHQRRVIRSYALWALTESGFPGDQLSHWVNSAKGTVGQLRDPYRLALICLTLYNYGDTETGNLAADRLVNWQKDDGRVSSTSSDHMTMNKTARDVETTSLALLCWLKRGGESGCPILALRWLISNCNMGNFGSVNCTAIAAKAVIAYYRKFSFQTPTQIENSGDDTDSEDNKPNSWELQATVNDGGIETISVPQFMSHQSPFQIDHINPMASNELAISLRASHGYKHGFLPFCVQAKYKLKKLQELAIGENKKLEVMVKLPENIVLQRSILELNMVLKNHSEETLELVICQIGVPVGLQVEQGVLDCLLRKRNHLTSYTIENNTIFFCFQHLSSNGKVDLDIECSAVHAGHFSAPPSCVYMANDTESCVWCPGLSITVAVDTSMRAKIEEEQAKAEKLATEATQNKEERAGEGATLSGEGLMDEQHRTSCFF